MEHRSHIYGGIGEFGTPEQLIQAPKKTREAGYRHVDAYAPFPVEGLSEALRLHRSWVPFITLLGGLAGGLGGFGLQYWAAAITYPQNIGGRPLNSWPAFIPVTFELTILGASAAPAAPSGFQRAALHACVNGPLLHLHPGPRQEVSSCGHRSLPTGTRRASRLRGV